MAKGRSKSASNPAELYKAASFGLAWTAAVASVAFGLLYFWLLDDAPQGWFNDFLIAALPSAAVVALTYVVGYYFLIRRGMSRDQRLVENFLETLGERSAVAPEVLSFAGHPRELDWTGLFDGAQTATVLARWLDAWSNENFSLLARFFERGGTMSVFVLDPDNETALSLAAAQHSGFSERQSDVDPKRKVVTGIKRLLKATTRSPHANALAVHLVTNPQVVLTQTLMLFGGDGGVRLVSYAIDNFRDEGHRGSALVLDPRASVQLQEFWQSELRGFERWSRVASASELASWGPPIDPTMPIT